MRAGFVILSVGAALRCVGVSVEAGSLPPPNAAVPLPGVEAAAIPLSDPVWVPDGNGLRQVNPGTEEYYRLRIEGRCHVESGLLVPSLCLDAEVVQAVSDSQLILREVVPSRHGHAATGYVGYARGRLLAVSVPDAGRFPAGSVQHVQLRVESTNLVAETAAGSVAGVLACQLVSSPCLAEYLGAGGEEVWARPADPVVGIKPAPESAPASSLELPPPSRPYPSAPLPGDSTLVDRKVQELQRRQDDLRDQIRRRTVVMASIERARDRAANPEERAAMEHVLIRARSWTAMLEGQLSAASNEARRVESERTSAPRVHHGPPSGR